jgi:hypothetical protein
LGAGSLAKQTGRSSYATPHDQAMLSALALEIPDSELPDPQRIGFGVQDPDRHCEATAASGSHPSLVGLALF